MGARVSLAGAVLVALALCVADAAVWEHQHDEGVTFDVSVGRVELDTTPVPIRTVYAQLDGSAAPSLADVATFVGQGGRMLNPPLYYAAVDLWARMFGTGTLVLRAPAWLLAALSVFGLGLLARRLAPEAGAPAVAALLLAVLPWLANITNFLRPYGLVLALTIFSTLAALSAIGPRAEEADEAAKAAGTRSRAGARIAFVVLSLMGLYTVYHYLLLLVWQGLVLLVLALRSRETRRGQLVALAVMVALIGLGFAPWLPTLQRHMDVTAATAHHFSGIAPLQRWPELGVHLLETFALGEAVHAVGVDWVPTALAVLGIATALLLLLLFRRGVRVRLAPEAAIIWRLLPVLPALIVAADLARGTHTVFIGKYSLPLLPFLIIAVARAWLALPFRPLAWAGPVVLAAVLLTASAAHMVTRAAESTNHEILAQQIAQRDEVGHLVVFSSLRRGHATPLVLSLRDAGATQVRLAHAGADELDALIAAAAADPAITRLTLVNLYVHGQTDTESWPGPVLRRVARQAPAQGWRVRSGDPEFLSTARDGGKHVLTLASPVYAKFFFRDE